MPRELPEIEKAAEELIKAFPKNPLVFADIHSIAVSLKRVADAMETRNKPMIVSHDFTGTMQGVDPRCVMCLQPMLEHARR